MKNKESIATDILVAIKGMATFGSKRRFVCDGMDLYAKDIAVGFYEWMDKNKYEKYANSDAGCIWYFNEPPTAGKQTYFELNELFNQYIQTLNQ